MYIKGDFSVRNFDDVIKVEFKASPLYILLTSSLDISKSSKYFKVMSLINDLRNLKLYDYPVYLDLSLIILR